MATTVYSGTGNFAHTNSSGGNQRIPIYWLKIGGSFDTDFKKGIKQTVDWYLDNKTWLKN